MTSCKTVFCLLCATAGALEDSSCIQDDRLEQSAVSLLQTSLKFVRNPETHATGHSSNTSSIARVHEGFKTRSKLVEFDGDDHTLKSLAKSLGKLHPEADAEHHVKEAAGKPQPKAVSKAPDSAEKGLSIQPQSYRSLHVGLGIVILAASIFFAIHRNLSQRAIEYAVPIGWGAAYMVWSVLLVFCNKSLAKDGHFPHPIMLVSCHQLFSAGISHLLLWLTEKKPECQTGGMVEEPRATSGLPWSDYSPHMWRVSAVDPVALKGLWRTVCIIAAFNGAVLVAENRALYFSTVAFLQMMKEAGLIYVVAISFMAGTESISLRRCGLIFLMVVGGLLCIRGEVQFSMTGFSLQMGSSLVKALMLVLQAKVLRDKALKLDPLVYTALVTPACALVLLPFAAFELIMSSTNAWGEISSNLVPLAASCLLAGTFNIINAGAIQSLGAIGFGILQTLKNAMILFCSTTILGVPTTFMQMLGCVMILTLVPLYSTVKRWEHAGENPETKSDKPKATS